MPVISKFNSSGNIELLSQKRIALFASRNAPAEIHPAATALFEALGQMSISIAGGWQAPLEKKCLDRLPKSPVASIIFYTATAISARMLSPGLQKLNTENKLLLLSVEDAPERADKSDVDKRDRLLFSQIKQILFLYIAPNGRLGKIFNTLLQKGFAPLVLDHPCNRAFIASGGLAINEDNIGGILQIPSV